mgnify:CR=1 FL=1
MNDKDFVEGLKEQIAKSPEKFPFIAPMWEITIASSAELKVAKYARHQTKSHITRPFYKPISKIVDIGKMDENEK